MSIESNSLGVNMKVEELLREKLPPPWNYGVTRDGRVFFVNEESHENTWLHPVSGQPVQTGHRTNEELPRGWEYAYTIEGIPYFIDHINQRNTFQNPVTGEQYAIPWSPAQNIQQQQFAQHRRQQDPRHQDPVLQNPRHLDARQQDPQLQDTKQDPAELDPGRQDQWPQDTRQQENQYQHEQRASEPVLASESSETQSQVFVRQKSDRKRQSTKRKSKSRVVKGLPEPKRDFSAAVSLKGWLNKQEGGGLKSWKKRFIVLSDFCLFFYKDSTEQDCVGAVSLPSYSINPCLHDGNINKKYAFKAEHQNLKTHYFAAENEGDMKTWMNALSLASIAQTDNKNPQRDEEKDEDAGFFSGSRSPSENMKRISSNQLFPPQQPYRDANQHQPSHGYHRNQNPHYSHERSDSYSQGSGSNRSAMNSSGNPGYRNYPHNQSPQVEMRSNPNHSYSNSEGRSSGIHDPFFVQSPPDEGYNMDAYDPTRQIKSRQDHVEIDRHHQHKDNRNMDQRTTDSTTRLAPGYGGEPRDISPNQRHQDQRYFPQHQPDQRLQQRPQDPRQFTRDQRQSEYYQRTQDPQDQRLFPQDQKQQLYDQRRLDQREEGYSSSSQRQGSGQDRQPVSGSNSRLYNSNNPTANQIQDQMNTQRYDSNQRHHPPPTQQQDHMQSSHPGPEPRHSNQSSLLSQNQTFQHHQPFRSSQQHIGAAPSHRPLHHENSMSMSSTTSSQRDMYGHRHGDRHSERLVAPSSVRVERVSPQRGPEEGGPFSERAVDVPRGDGSMRGAELGYRQEYNTRIDPRHPHFEQRHDIPHDPRLQQSHDHQKRSPDPRIHQSHEQNRSPEQRLDQSHEARQQSYQYGGHDSRQSQQRQENRSYQPNQREHFVTKGYAQPFPPTSQMTSDPRQRPSHQRDLDPSATLSTGRSDEPYGRSPNQSQSSQERVTPRADNTADSMMPGRSGLGEGGGAKYFEPLVIDTSPIHEPSNETQASGTPLLKAEARPVVPPDMMPKFVHELAESQTPNTRSNMLTAMETAIIRREREPLVFQYPEVKVAHREPIKTQHKQDEVAPTPQDRLQNFSHRNNAGSYAAETRRSDTRLQSNQPKTGQYAQQGHVQNQPQHRHSYGQPNPYSQPASQPNQYVNKQPSPQQQMTRKSPYTERKTYETATAVLPPMPNRPPPRRMTSSEKQSMDDKTKTLSASDSQAQKTAAQELKDMNKQSVEYCHELESKEEQRLNKHIAASFKRLSLGSELSHRFKEESDLGYRNSKDVRKSLDLEVERSMINDIGKYDPRMVSTPNADSYGGNDTVKNNRLSHGFAGFLDDNQGDVTYSQNRNDNNELRQSKDYRQTDQVAVVDMQDDTLNSSKGLMEDIDHEVTSIKNKISSLKNLLEVETRRLSPVLGDGSVSEASMPNSHHDGPAGISSPWDYGMTRNKEEVDLRIERLKEEQKGDRHSYAHSESHKNAPSSHSRQRSYDNTLSAKEQGKGQMKSQLSLGNVTHQRQRSPDRYPNSGRDTNTVMHKRQRSFDSNTSGSRHQQQPPLHQRQTSFDRTPISIASSKPPPYERQASFASSVGSSRPVKSPRSNHQGNTHGSGRRDVTNFDQDANSIVSSSQQSSLQNVNKSPSYVHSMSERIKDHDSSYSGDHNRSSSFGDKMYPLAKGPSSVSSSSYKGSEDKGRSLNNQGLQQGEKTWKSLKGSQELYRKSSNTIEWHETRPGLFSPSKDDSFLLERSRSEKVKQNMVQLESRPKSYAEGLKPPLTKLEKLQLENKISRSLGDINLQDLEKQSHEFMDKEGIRREGYDPEWDAIKNALKHRDLPQGMSAPMGRSFDNSSAPSAPTSLPYKSPSMGRKQPPPQDHGYSIGAIKEDPNMPDSDVLEARPLTHIHSALDKQRLRLSISAGDLIGKSHEELVLLLIQLRRAQSRLEGEKSYFKGTLEDAKLRQGSFSRLPGDMNPDLQDLRRQSEEVDKQLEVHKPLVNLVDNLVTMGSLYGGNNLMMASQYKKHKLHPDQYTAPKEMIEFSRRHQEQRLVKEQEEELRKLTEEEIQLEEKLQQLFELDRRLQEKSFHVSSLQDNKEHLEKAFDSVRKQEEWETDPREHRRLSQQKTGIEQELTRTRQQLAESSRDLEETAAENAKVEHEVILLRKKVYGADKSSPTVAADNMKARAKLERELDKISTVMEGLNKQGAKLQQVMDSLGSESKVPKPENSPKNNSTYYVTDLDTMTSEDMSRSSVQPQRDPNEVNAFKNPPEVQRSVHDGQLKLSSSVPNVYKPSISPSEHAQKFDVNQNTVGQANSQSVGMNRSQPYGAVTGQTRSVPQDGIYTAKKIFVHSPSPSRTPPETQVTGERLDSSESDVPQYSPMDINEADDNTKRFYGILPKEKSKSQTLRDVKKREFERKSRDRSRPEDMVDNDTNVDTRDYRKRSQSLPRRVSDPWGGTQRDQDTKSFDDLVRRPRRKLDPERRKSAAERLFPSSGMSEHRSISSVNLNSEDRVKSITSIFTPRPFGTPSKSSPAVSIRPVRMQSNPQLSTGPYTWQKDQDKHPSPVLSSPPREGEPRDVPEHSKPQVTFAPPRQSTQNSVLQKPSPVTIATVHPVQNASYHDTDHTENITTKTGSSNFMQQFNSWKQNKQNPTATVRPLPNSPSHQKKSRSALKNQRSNPRRQTISSSQPAWFESPARKEGTVTSVAGDLISGGKPGSGRGLVRSGSLQELNFDKDTIDKMVLYTPDKVEIPERYIPDSDDESITEDERLQRQEKADKMRKMLVEHSLQDWQESDIKGKQGLHQSLNQEKRRREQVMDIKYALAREVTQKSKEVAVNRMKAMSSGNVNGDHWGAEPYDDSQYDGLLQALPYSPQQEQGFYA